MRTREEDGAVEGQWPLLQHLKLSSGLFHFVAPTHTSFQMQHREDRVLATSQNDARAKCRAPSGRKSSGQVQQSRSVEGAEALPQWIDGRGGGVGVRGMCVCVEDGLGFDVTLSENLFNARPHMRTARDHQRECVRHISPFG